MKSNFVIHILVGVCVLGARTIATGADLFRDNFDAHPLGVSIRGLLPEVGPAWNASSPFTPSVSSITSAGSSGNQLTLTSLPGIGVPYVYAEFTSSAPIVQMSFDWRIPADLNFSSAAPAIFLTTPELTTGIAIIQSGFFNLLGKPNVAGNYHASITLYFQTDEVELRIDDLATQNPTDGFRRSAAVVPISHISGFEFDMPHGEIGSMSIDNLVVTEIPEPNSCLLLTFAAATIFRLSTRRRKSVAHHRV